MSKTILVVEDDSDMRALINRHLLNAGYVVRVAANGLEAAAACLSVIPDLIISDVHMPRMNGFEMIAILKSEPAMQDIPVIFLTADAKGRRKGNKLGEVAYLTKPLKVEALLKAMAEPFKPAALLMLVGSYLQTNARVRKDHLRPARFVITAGRSYSASYTPFSNA